ncbi:hypothetical protein DFJ43DRAFT_991641 [Lentinula guzmanii]|uniref:Uncharacterized protein n=1 Tax=Lentinula guzmanii TaxID=2804957 RepID=A0AA38JE33_9AGAR|nr:hypothetical protein DFJ43DRAFT_991641 [Lentinula guzmanii]
MAQKCRDRKDHDGERYYNHAVDIYNHLKAGGMSEEEDATEEIRVGNRVQRRRYKKIRILYRRNPIVATINERVDALPHDADNIFDARGGGRRLERKRVGEISGKPLPRDLPASLYRPEYLQTLQPYEIDALKLSSVTWQLLDLEHLMNPDHMDIT